MDKRAYDPLVDETPGLVKVDPYEFFSFPGFTIAEPGIIFVNGRYHVYLNSITTSAKCICCGNISYQPRRTYQRNPQDFPINGKSMVLHIRPQLYICSNPNCSKQTFAEKIDGIKRYQQRTNRLNSFSLALSLPSNSVSASRTLSGLGGDVSHDSIRQLIFHIPMPDISDVEYIIVDDVADKKGSDYFTVVYEGKNRVLLELIDGRDGEGFYNWLLQAKEVKFVNRDRASAYSYACKRVGRGITQIADRFHLYKNLHEDYISNLIKANIETQILIGKMSNGEIGILKNDNVEKITVLKVRLEDPILETLNYDNTPPLDENGDIVWFDDKSHNLYCKENQEQAIINRKKVDKINAVKQYRIDYPKSTLKEISKKFNISIPTVRTYLNMSPEEVKKKLIVGNSYSRSDSYMYDYTNIIYKMVRDGHDGATIYSYILKRGYNHAHSSLSNLITCIANNNFRLSFGPNDYTKDIYPDGIVAISRRSLYSYICSSVSNRVKYKDKPVGKYFDLIKSNFQAVSLCDEICKDFDAAIKEKSTDKMMLFLEKYEDTKISGFVTGIRRDLDAVLNGIKFESSSGPGEGNNNMFKVIKRNLFGRAETEYLKRKTRGVFQCTKMNESADDLLKEWFESI